MTPAEFVTKHEGVRYRAYKDSLGVPTVGVGFNLRRDGAAEALAKVGANVEDVLAGLALTPRQVNDLLRADLQECTDDLGRMFADFAKMPENIRLVLIDLRFNLGPTRMRGFTNTLDSFRRGDYRDAARRLRISLWASQVGKRADEDIDLVLLEAKNAGNS